MHFDNCKAALDAKAAGRKRKLNRSERHSARVVEQRLTMFVRDNPREPVELSPYMKSLMGEEFDGEFGVREAMHRSIAASV